MYGFKKLRRPAVLACLAIILLSFSVAMTSGQLQSSSLLNIDKATLEGKYFFARYTSTINQSIIIFSPEILVYRADVEKGEMHITSQVIPDSALAKLQGNREFTIEVGPDVDTGGFSAIPLQGNLTVSGTASQEPKIDASFEWNHSEMHYALFSIKFENLAAAPITMETQVLILPKDTTLLISSGIYGYNGKADIPALVYSPNYIKGHKDMLFQAEGLSPVTNLETVAIDGKPLSKAPWVAGTADPGTWMAEDPMDASTLQEGITYAYGFGSANITGFLYTHLPFQGGYVGYPLDIKTGLHELTVTATPYPNPGAMIAFNLSGITENEGRKLTAKFLLFGPSFTLSKQRIAPGETLMVNGSGFAPFSRVKIFAQVDTSGRDIPGGEIMPITTPPENVPASNPEIREVEIGSASTDPAGNFTAQLQLPNGSSDFFKDIWSVLTTLPAYGSIKVKIDDLAFQGRYAGVPEVDDGVADDIAYLPPGVTAAQPATPQPAAPQPSGTSALSAGNISAVPAVSGIVPGATSTAPGPSSSQTMPPITTSSPATNVIDYAMASNIDEATNEAAARTNTFSSTDSRAYSWLSLANVGAGTAEWIWYSPDGSQYYTGTVDIPAPTSGATWGVYNVWDYINIAGSDAANLPGNWQVDVFLDGSKLLTEQFSVGTSGGASAKLSVEVPKTLSECEMSDTQVCGTWTLEGDQFNANWGTSDKGTVKIERWDAGGVVLTRNDIKGLAVRYEGNISGNKIENGVITWTGTESTWSGNWSAEWT